ncbi:MAG: hypothetical protein HGB05_02070, partial [Chloroflexi bacterium]|nr:hypothetical protein [Chloroflexota bacterium]
VEFDHADIFSSLDEIKRSFRLLVNLIPGNGLNLEAEAVAQVEAIAERKDYLLSVATEKARRDYAEERLRLLYVGITRATRELILTWNTGSRDDQPKQPAAPFIALHAFMDADPFSERE